MKNLDLATLGVEEMNEVEMREVDGGILGALAVGLACVAVGVVLSDWSGFKNGVSDALNCR